MFELIRWLTVCLIISIIMKPLFPLKALRPADGGFSVSLGLGSGILFLTVWFVCAVTGIPFDTVICILVPVIFAAVFFVEKKVKGKEGHRSKEEEYASRERHRFLKGFIVFAVLFASAFWVKGFKPYIDYQTEQYMDYGFMNAMYRQRRVPFEDIWFAGKRVNYYYLGQAVAVFFCRFSFVTPDYGYNLMLCTLFASLALSVFSLADAFLASMPGMKRISSLTGGVAASLMCTCGGNGHWLVYGIIGQLRDSINGIIPEKKYWFPTSTLFIGYDPDIADKAKHEFPSYTLILGDLHAHVCNMFFTIPFLMILFDYVLCQAKAGRTERFSDDDKYAFLREIFDKRLLIMGLMLGLFRGVNYWDFPIYYVVAGAVILFCDLRIKGLRMLTVISVLLKGVFIYIAGTVIMLPFTSNYTIPFMGIHLCDRHSPLYKFIIIWFVHIVIVLSLLLYVFIKSISKEGRNRRAEYGIHSLIITAFSLCGLGLLLLPELVYVKDIYGDVYQRYNTMFKLTFQGFIILSISAGICIGIFLNADTVSRRIRLMLKSFGCIFCAASLALAAYTGWSVREWFGNVFDISCRNGISACAFIQNDPLYDNVREAIDILKDDPDTRIHIIEEAGTSYKPESRLSVFTGASTIAGWYVHEWVWRNDSDTVRKRHGEVKRFYTGGDGDYCRDICDKYDLDYIYVGPETVKKYEVDYSGFEDLGEHLWESDDNRYMLIRTEQILHKR